MDERVLILYHSALRQTWAAAAQQRLQQQHPQQRSYPHEAAFAATQIQRVIRGRAARTRFAAFDGPRRQRAARTLQFALRWLVLGERVAQRVHRKRLAMATRLQSWYRGCSCRERLRDAAARAIVQRVVLLQRRFRGYRFWRVVAEMLHERQCERATAIQRVFRGWKGRRRAADVRFEQQRFVRNLVAITEAHRRRAQCARCALATCTEASLFDCFMARFVGLLDFRGAQALGLDGVTRFPSSGRFCFFYAVLLLVRGEDVGVAMQFLHRALRVLGVSDDALAACEQQYFLPALQLRPKDAAVYLELAVMCQSSESIARAETFYAKALALVPVDYAVPGFLNRVQTLDWLLFNYHRFCSVFNSRHTNVLAKVVAVAKRSEQIRFMVAKMNQYTAIFPADAANAGRVNAIYLSDDEVCAFLSEHGSAITVEKPSASALAADGKGSHLVSSLGSKRSLRSAASWRNSSQKSMRQVSARKAPSGAEPNGASSATAPSTTGALSAAVCLEVEQLFQNAFCGLNVRPDKLAATSAKRSRITISRDHADLILKHLVFIDPGQAGLAASFAHHERVFDGVAASSLSWMSPPAAQNAAPCYVMVLPWLLKQHQQRQAKHARSFAAVDVQRVFRGFRYRVKVQRELLVQLAQQRQVDEMLAQLHAKRVAREKRRASAVAIQRVFKGYAHRRRLRRWHAGATTIQRVFRGHRGRERARAFRDGNSTFYMAEKVFQRGVEISGRRVLLSIEKCGLSFRFDGYDLDECATLPGFLSRESTLMLLCYLNWTHAESLVGKECALGGVLLVIAGVECIDRATAECSVSCLVVGDERSTAAATKMKTTKTATSGTSDGMTSQRDDGRVGVPLADCIQSINLRSLSTRGKDAAPAELPLALDDTARIVRAITERLELVPAIPMATKELKKNTPENLLIAVIPPPRMHMLFKPGNDAVATISELARRQHVAPSAGNTRIRSKEQIRFPVTDGLRGASAGRTRFRKKCARHATHFQRCWCVLPMVSTPAHIEALMLALAPSVVVSVDDSRDQDKR
ncbi:hypothetical protein PybrP1_000316 [[Pythium] brassicae (nom. inval.)]|nr:hypothetical protein PybrP1_000316 [[Pythium] brassicae (nom. inval.)]